MYDSTESVLRQALAERTCMSCGETYVKKFALDLTGVLLRHNSGRKRIER